jgi:hypothetical protein
MKDIPVFAVLGHPNEGKSSVVATLVENDRIRISPVPGETVRAQEYPVIIDGEPCISFVDTPGFQNPVRTLDWMREHPMPEADMVAAFLSEHAHDPDLRHEIELLTPLMEGAGVIYVADASRPLRQVDLAEMEILRLTGRPRMAILNCKTGEEGFLEEWKNALRRNFNVVRMFNALAATFAERLRLLESLRFLEQDWEAALSRVVDAFVQDWDHRNAECSALACEFLKRILTMREEEELSDLFQRDEVEARLGERLEERIRDEEARLHADVCRLFRHDSRSFTLPEHSMLQEDLFSQTTWKVFGLGRRELAVAAAAAGGAAGAVVDVATLGHTLGLAAVVSGAAAGLTALFRGERLVRKRMLGMKIGARTVQVGPVNTVQWVYVLLDRFLLHYWHVIHWTHARRDEDVLPGEIERRDKLGLTSTWGSEERKACVEFFRSSTDESATDSDVEEKLRSILEKELREMSER